MTLVWTVFFLIFSSTVLTYANFDVEDLICLNKCFNLDQITRNYVLVNVPFQNGAPYFLTDDGIQKSIDKLLVDKDAISTDSYAILTVLGILYTKILDFATATEYFRQACEDTNYSISSTVVNYAKSVADPLLGLSILQRGLEKSPQSAIIHKNLIKTHQDLNKDSLKSLSVKQMNQVQYDACRQAPYAYDIWILFVELQLERLISQSISSIDVEVQELLYLGLSVFPNCPGLLYLLGTSYYIQKDIQCALILYKLSDKYKSFAEGFIYDIFNQGIVERNILHLEMIINQTSQTNSKSVLDYTISRHCTFFNPLHRIEQFNNHKNNYSINLSNISIYTETESETEIISNNPFPIPFYLHLGCNYWKTCARPGWVVVDAMEGLITHRMGTIDNLSYIPTGVIDLLYASHVLEHVPYTGRECIVCRTLKEWRRVLKLSGLLLVSVPDLITLSEILIDPKSSADTRYTAMTCMFAGGKTEYEHHYVGFYWEYLSGLLTQAGFCDLRRVTGGFGLFADTSDSTLEGRYLSLNVEAKAC